MCLGDSLFSPRYVDIQFHLASYQKNAASFTAIFGDIY